MMLLSVLVAAISIQNAVSRRLYEYSNEVSPFGYDNAHYSENPQWVKISNRPDPYVEAEYGSRLELECSAMGSPPPIIIWYKRHTKLTENEPDIENMGYSKYGLAKVRSRLIINYVLPRHQDMYRCVAISGSREASTILKLIVPSSATNREMNFTQLLQSNILGAHHKPKVTFWAETYMDIIGSDAYLPCRTVGNPKPNLVWKDPQDEVITNEDERIQVLPNGDLKIAEIQWSDMGDYKCIVTNMVGEAKALTFLYPMQRSDK